MSPISSLSFRSKGSPVRLSSQPSQHSALCRPLMSTRWWSQRSCWSGCQAQRLTKASCAHLRCLMQRSIRGLLRAPRRRSLSAFALCQLSSWSTRCSPNFASVSPKARADSQSPARGPSRTSCHRCRPPGEAYPPSLKVLCRSLAATVYRPLVVPSPQRNTDCLIGRRPGLPWSDALWCIRDASAASHGFSRFLASHIVDFRALSGSLGCTSLLLAFLFSSPGLRQRQAIHRLRRSELRIARPCVVSSCASNSTRGSLGG